MFENREIKLVIMNGMRNYLLSETNHLVAEKFSDTLIAKKIRKTKVMNKSVYLGQSVLDLSKICVYEFWHNHIQEKY